MGLIPVTPPGGFEVADLNRGPGFPADANRFLDGLQQGIPFTTDMAEIKSVSISDDFDQLNQLFGRGKGSRRVNKTGAQTDGTVMHCPDDQILHLVHLAGIRPPFAKIHHRRPDGTLTDQGNHIERTAPAS